MVQKKLKSIRKQKGLSQENIAEILCIDISSYCRKENGKSKIYDDEWEKLAKALDVPVEELKSVMADGTVHNDISAFNDHSGNFYDQKFNTPSFVIENLQHYIYLLEEQNDLLKKEIETLKK